jgi:hypothetical protein
MFLSERRWQRGGVRDLPIISAVSDWILGTRDPKSLLFMLVVLSIVGLLFSQGCRLVWVGPLLWSCG